MDVSLANILLSATPWMESSGQSRTELALLTSLSSLLLSLSATPLSRCILHYITGSVGSLPRSVSVYWILSSSKCMEVPSKQQLESVKTSSHLLYLLGSYKKGQKMLFSWRSISREAVAYYGMFDHLLQKKKVQEWTTASKNIWQDLSLFLQSCLDDALNALYNELRFSFEGLPSSTNLSPALAPQAQMTSTYPVSNYWLLPTI